MSPPSERLVWYLNWCRPTFAIIRCIAVSYGGANNAAEQFTLIVADYQGSQRDEVKGATTPPVRDGRLPLFIQKELPEN